MVKQNTWLAPFIRSKLPHLTCRKNTDNSIPRIRAELVQGLNGINNIISLSARPSLATWFNYRTLAIDRYQIFRSSGTLSSSMCTSLCRWFKSATDKSVSTGNKTIKRTCIDSWRNRRTLNMVIRDVGDEDIIIIGYTFSTQNVSGVTFDNRKGVHALCLRA
jgi:hypothetical protein